MDNRLTIFICTLLWSMSFNSVLAQTGGDSVEYIKVSGGVMQLKKVKSKEINFEFKGAELKKLLSETDFTYLIQHPLTTRSGFLLGWHFKFNDQWMINVYFDKNKLKESDNVYLNDLKLDSVMNKKIRRIEIIKER